jgi:hypothetical protein
VLSDCQRHLETEVVDPLVGRGHIAEVGDLDVDVLDAGADRVDREPIDRGDRDGVVALVDPQEADLELEATDGFVDVVGEPGIEDAAVVAAHLKRLGGGDGTGAPLPASATKIGFPATLTVCSVKAVVVMRWPRFWSRLTSRSRLVAAAVTGRILLRHR